MLSEKINNNNLFKRIYETSKEIFSSGTLTQYDTKLIEQINKNTKEDKFGLNLVEDRNSRNIYYFQGYPTGNYLKIVCKYLEIWCLTGKFNISFIEINSIDESSNLLLEEYKNQINKLVLNLSNVSQSESSSLTKLLINIFEILGMRGFSILLGLRITSKYYIDLPPKKEILINEFNRRISEKSKLTVGARAFAKHSDRNKKVKFWGQVKGSEEERNISSNKICLDIIQYSAWISIFSLSKTCKIIEIRNKEEFGLRWEYVDDKKIVFKGLVEPNIKNRNSDSD
jgi:hypothetical protein